MSERKPNPHKKLNLGPEKRDQLIKLMRTPGMGYESIRVWIQKEWGISTSLRALSEFWEEETTRESEERITKAVVAANAIGNRADEVRPGIERALRATLSQAAFELLTAGADEKRVQTLVDMALNMDRTELARGNLELELKKLSESIKSSQEKGLDALFVEIRGNKEAEEFFQKLKAVVMKPFST